MYKDQLQRAEQKLDRIFKTKQIDGQRVDVSRGHRKKWSKPLNPGYFGIPKGNRKYVVAPATIAIDDFLRIQAGTFGLNVSDTEFGLGAYDETVSRAATDVKQIPTPVLEIKASGKIPQEGRSRAMGAKQAGETYMPVWLAIQVYR